MKMTRKQFLGLAGGTTVVMLVHGCGGGSSAGTAGTPAPPAGNDCGAAGAEISANHGHEVTIPDADLDATASQTYSIRGTADHDHTITLTAAMLAALKAGTSVVVSSSSAVGHMHDVTVSCG
ncbi:hypothetical protein [Piscinibacter sp.]|uniref:hypothetical protein n=1 Tax=Piscinibacter sp. TaxID=1903157 RepID=UPI002C16627D|nr:hypothetical protein [Albitalea sp.]HUG23571.1 hypothetical protein [Albitalea sp.]